MNLKFSTPVTAKALQTDTYFYVATPYSKYPGGIDKAFKDASRATGLLIQAGVKVYCPIAHTHPVAIFSGLDPLDHGIWLEADRTFMETASGMIVVKMKTWDESIGIQHECQTFARADKPILYMEWPQ